MNKTKIVIVAKLGPMIEFFNKAKEVVEQYLDNPDKDISPNEKRKYLLNNVNRILSHIFLGREVPFSEVPDDKYNSLNKYVDEFIEDVIDRFPALVDKLNEFSSKKDLDSKDFDINNITEITYLDTLGKLRIIFDSGVDNSYLEPADIEGNKKDVDIE